MSTNLDLTRRGRGLATLLVAVALLAAACGGGNPGDLGVASHGSPATGSPSSSDSTAASSVGYSRCMRSHGVPDFPDPTPTESPSRPTRSSSESATPCTRRPSKPASTCSRRPAHSNSSPTSACCPATVQRAWYNSS